MGGVLEDRKRDRRGEMTLEINRLYKDKLEAKYAEIERLRGVLQE